MKAIILLGAPGAGKGTLAEGIKTATDYEHVSTGDMLREAVKAGRPVGLEAKSYMEKGELVPDQVIMKIVTERLKAGPDSAQYMFDGFPAPRRRRAAGRRAGGTGGSQRPFLLEVPRDVLSPLERTRVCKNCGADFHVSNIRPKWRRLRQLRRAALSAPGHCEADGSEPACSVRKQTRKHDCLL
jgi:adenylate kinase